MKPVLFYIDEEGFSNMIKWYLWERGMGLTEDEEIFIGGCVDGKEEHVPLFDLIEGAIYIEVMESEEEEPEEKGPPELKVIPGGKK